MRVAILADTHMPKGSRQLPARCLEEIEAAELVLHLGDFSARSVLDELRSLGRPVRAVYGNVDDAELRAELPERAELRLEGVKLGLVHDAGPARGRLERMRAEFAGADAVLFGHSHIPLHERAAGFQIFNPGSPTERRRSPHRSMGVAAISGGRLRLRHVILE